MHHLINENLPADLKSMAHMYTDMGGYELELKAAQTRAGRKHIPPEILYKYNTGDCVVPILLVQQFIGKLKAEGVWEYYTEYQLELMKWLWHSERAGMPVSYLGLLQLRRTYGARLEELLALLRKEIKRPEFNPNSPPQLGDVLFKELKYPVIRVTDKDNPSTDGDTLNELKTLGGDDDPFLDALLEYREISKMHGTFVKGWMSRLDLDFMLHPSLNNTGTKTGRLASSNPNGQQVPRGPIIRSLVKARPGDYCAAGDLSQAEFRVAAVMSKDPILEAEMRAGKDFHTTTANVVFGKRYRREPDPDKKNEMRARAKMANFKILYGGQQFEEAYMREFVEDFFEKFPGVKKWMARCNKYVKKGEMVLSLGRKRRFPPALDFRDARSQHRQAINAGPQNAASEWNNKVFIKLWRYVMRNKLKSHPVLMVHDSIISFGPKAEKEEFTEAYRNYASKPVPFLDNLVIPCEIGIGDNWYSAEKAAKK